MRVCHARASRALTSVVHSFCECIERPHFRVCGEPVGLEDRFFCVVRGCAECAGARGSAGLHASKNFGSASVTLIFFVLSFNRPEITVQKSWQPKRSGGSAIPPP